MAAKKAKTEQDPRIGKYAIICNDRYGIYAGVVSKITDQANGKMKVEGKVRHVPRWYGKSGGITSLAAFGLCGPSAASSRVGASVDATLTEVMNIFVCSDEARASLEAATQQ